MVAANQEAKAAPARRTDAPPLHLAPKREYPKSVKLTGKVSKEAEYPSIGGWNRRYYALVSESDDDSNLATSMIYFKSDAERQRFFAPSTTAPAEWAKRVDLLSDVLSVKVRVEEGY